MVRAEAASYYNRIVELELHLLDAEDKSFKAEEGQAVVEFDLSNSKEAEKTILYCLGRESTRSASLEVALAGAECSLAQVREELQSVRAILDVPELLESHFRGSIVFCASEKRPSTGRLRFHEGPSIGPVSG